MDRDRFQKVFLLLLVVAVTVLFVGMLRPFLMAVFLAAVFAGVAHPLYRRLGDRMGGRRAPAALATLALLILVVALPLAAVLGVVANQALNVSQTVVPWVQRQLSEPDALNRLLSAIPGHERLEPYRDLLLTKAGQIVGSTSTFLFRSVSATTRGTVSALFQLFVLLYCMYFFLVDGGAWLRRILWYLPLREADERRVLERFASVTRATLKGTLLIGLAQGVLAGAAFAVAGIEGAVFWGTLMVVLSVIPGVGTGLVWIPAAVVLALSGHWLRAVLLAAFCAGVVGSVDNLLRPRLVGRDTRLHELLIFFGTVGGLMAFGVLGFLVGPIVAALFVSVWDLYGRTFGDALPDGEPGVED